MTRAMLVAFMLQASCAKSGPDTCKGACALDPVLHCVHEAGCTSWNECPFGLACVDVAPSGACQGPDDLEPRCRPPTTPEINRFALQAGFRVPELAIIYNSTPTPTLTWEQPSRVRWVSCAVFVCPPLVEPIGADAVGDEEPYSIVNFQTCAVVHQTVSASARTFELVYDAQSAVQIDPVDPDSSCRDGDAAVYERVYTELTAGCWAYDDTRLILASRLIRLTPDEVPTLDAPTSLSCADLPDQTACYDAERQRFGACLAGACQPRCTTALDCELASPPGDGTTCSWTCVRPSPARLGICAPT